MGTGINSASVTLGLIHSLTLLKPGVGYFRPIDHTTHGGNRSALVKEVYKLPDPVKDMQGLSQEEAVALISQDRLDDLIDTIIKGVKTL